jgi:hypothetical protein
MTQRTRYLLVDVYVVDIFKSTGSKITVAASGYDMTLEINQYSSIKQRTGAIIGSATRSSGHRKVASTWSPSLDQARSLPRF